MASVHLRILGHITTLILQMSNLLAMHFLKDEEVERDFKIMVFRKMMYRYFTCWTVGLIIFHAAVALFCDLLILRNLQKKSYEVWKPLRGFRNVLFAALVWPSAMVVFIFFWSLFNYDRSLIFPEFIDKILSRTSNHILHTTIVPIVLWEVIFRPRVEPKSHFRNLSHLTVHALLYLAVLYYTYYSYGVWLYPIFHVTYGSINFLIVHFFLVALFVISYYMQWWLNAFIHGKMAKKKIK